MKVDPMKTVPMEATPMDIPFLSLKGVNARYADELKAAAARVIDSGWYVLGDEVSSFEREFAAYCGASHAVGVGNGLDALSLILRGYKELGVIEEGDEVIVPGNTFIASFLAITENRLVPVPVEPDPATFNLLLSHCFSIWLRGICFAAAGRTLADVLRRSSDARNPRCLAGFTERLSRSISDGRKLPGFTSALSS